MPFMSTLVCPGPLLLLPNSMPRVQASPPGVVAASPGRACTREGCLKQRGLLCRARGLSCLLSAAGSEAWPLLVPTVGLLARLPVEALGCSLGLVARPTAGFASCILIGAVMRGVLRGGPWPGPWPAVGGGARPRLLGEAAGCLFASWRRSPCEVVCPTLGLVGRSWSLGDLIASRGDRGCGCSPGCPRRSLGLLGLPPPTAEVRPTNLLFEEAPPSQKRLLAWGRGGLLARVGLACLVVAGPGPTRGGLACLVPLRPAVVAAAGLPRAVRGLEARPLAAGGSGVSSMRPLCGPPCGATLRTATAGGDFAGEVQPGVLARLLRSRRGTCCSWACSLDPDKLGPPLLTAFGV